MSEIPLLISCIYKEEAESVYGCAGQRLLRWAQAFEAWLEEHGRRYADPMAIKTARKSWREFYKFAKIMPWEVTEQDVKNFAEQLEKTGVSLRTKNRRVLDLSLFYEYCHLHQVDKPWAEDWEDYPGFNPARKVRFVTPQEEASGQYLDLEEVTAFMRALRQDSTILGKREYAFFLGLLKTGSSAVGFSRIKWEDIETAQGEVWVRIHIQCERKKRGKKKEKVRRRVRLPDDVWEAIVDYLKTAGRYDHMQAGDYVFAVLKDPLNTLPSGQAGEWTQERGYSHPMLKKYLMLYCRVAGLDPVKVTFPVLFNTAIMLRVEAGDTVEQVHEFLGWQGMEHTSNRINRMVQAERLTFWSEQPPRPIKRIPGSMRPAEDRITHGFYNAARPQGRNEIEAVSQEGQAVQVKSDDQPENGGLLAKMVVDDRQDESMLHEINKFRAVMERLYSMMANASTIQEGIRLVEVYGMALHRLSSAMKAAATMPNGNSELELALESVLNQINEEDEMRRREIAEGKRLEDIQGRRFSMGEPY
jgi:integrase